MNTFSYITPPLATFIYSRYKVSGVKDGSQCVSEKQNIQFKEIGLCHQLNIDART